MLSQLDTKEKWVAGSSARSGNEPRLDASVVPCRAASSPLEHSALASASGTATSSRETSWNSWSEVMSTDLEGDLTSVWGAVYYGMLSLTALWCCGARDKITPNGTPPSGLLNKDELGGRTACRKLE